jgi:hypothetical protein
MLSVTAPKDKAEVVAITVGRVQHALRRSHRQRHGRRRRGKIRAVGSTR